MFLFKLIKIRDMKSLKLKIKEYLDQRQAVLHYEHEREIASQKLLKIFDKELQKITPKKSILIKLDNYKRVLKLAKVPKIIIENPSYILNFPISDADIELIKYKIEEDKNK